MQNSKNPGLRFRCHSITPALAVLLGALAASGWVFAKDTGVFHATRVYSHTYDDVFQAALEEVERSGCPLENADKDKGIITYADHGYFKCTYEIHVESVSPKPETRVSVDHRCKVSWIDKKSMVASFGESYLGAVQKILATYR